MGGLYAATVLATSIGTYIFTRFLIPDVLVGLWLTLGYYFFLRALEQETPSQAACRGFAATCALNVLTEGLIGLVFRAGAIFLYLLVTGNLRFLLKLRVVECRDLFPDRGAMAHARGRAESGPRNSSRLLVVLFRERALEPVSEQTRTGRVRHRPSAYFLGIAGSLAAPVECISAAGAAGGSDAASPIAG